MNALIVQGVQARNEARRVCKLARWMVSPKDHAPLFGAFQDGLIGISELTQAGLTFNKWHSMSMFADIYTNNLDYTFSKKSYSNRDLISRLLPEINFIKRKPNMYKKEYAHLLKYNPDDISVNIERGVLKSGVIDKSTAGQGKAGSIFHVIANEYGNDYALETIYNFSQIVQRFFFYHSFTVGIHDIAISESAMREIKKRIAAMVAESNKITTRLNNGKLIAPLGTSLNDFYEAEQMNALSPGDDFVHPIFADIDLYNNGMAKLILSGSKGKPPNFIAINGGIGVQSINGKRFGAQAGWGRTSPYFTRYSTTPASRGYVSMSYREGVTSEVYPFMAGEARHGMISNALSTSITGHQNRVSVKNLETILVDNMRKSTKGMNVVQTLYAECGLNPAKTEKVKFNSVLISDKEFTDTYQCKTSHIDKKFKSKAVEKLLKEEFEQLKADRQYYHDIHTQLEDHNPKEYIMDNTKQLPVNPYRIIDDVVYNYSDVVDELDKKERILDPTYAINKVRELCDNLGYVFLNNIQRKKKRKIPEHMEAATTLLKILIRSYLCMRYMLKKGVINKLLDIIVERIEITYKKALIDYGTSVGILAAQCVSEPMTQFVLDSKHRAGGQGGTETNAIVRIQEILGAKDTKTMKNPHMVIMVKPEYETDRVKVQEIANHIEMMNFRRFITSTHVFYESFGKPVHPKFKHEEKIIQQILKHNYGQKKPSDLAKWCIRYELDKEELILKSISIETIVLAIRKAHPEIFLVYSPENSNVTFIRCYLRSGMFKASQNYYEDNVLPLAHSIKDVIVRGIDGLVSTSVIDVIRNVEQPDGSFKRQKVHGVFAVGTNLPAVLSNPYVDPYRTQSDSVEEMERLFGVVAARNKIINELIATLGDLSRYHCSIFADEMTYSGVVTNIQNTGLQKREMSNITLRLSFQTSVQVIQDAAINGLVDRIGGISGPLILGSTPSVGTTYNTFVVNEDFIKNNVASMEDVLEDL